MPKDQDKGLLMNNWRLLEGRMKIRNSLLESLEGSPAMVHESLENTSLILTRWRNFTVPETLQRIRSTCSKFPPVRNVDHFDTLSWRESYDRML